MMDFGVQESLDKANHGHAKELLAECKRLGIPVVEQADLFSAIYQILIFLLRRIP